MSTKSRLYFRSFVLLLSLVSIAFIWLLLPFYGAIFWGVILAIIFAPVQRRLLVLTRGRRTLATLANLIFILLIVIIPVFLMSGALVQEVLTIYKRMDSGELNFGHYVQQVISSLPPFVTDALGRLGIHNFSDVGDKLSQFAMTVGQFLTKQAVNIGSNTFQFIIGLGIMLYLLFFLLKDGSDLAAHCRSLVPLSEDQKSHLFKKIHHCDSCYRQRQYCRCCHSGSIRWDYVLDFRCRWCAVLGSSNGFVIPAACSRCLADLGTSSHLFPQYRSGCQRRYSVCLWGTGYWFGRQYFTSTARRQRH